MLLRRREKVIAYAYAGIFYDRRRMTVSGNVCLCAERIHGKVWNALYEKMEELLKEAEYREFICLHYSSECRE